MQVGYIQNAPKFGEKEKNFEGVRSLIKGIDADLLVLPELFATGYTFTSKEEARDQAEPFDGPTSQFMKEISKQTGAVMVGGFVEQEGNKVYNSLLIINGDKVIDTYRKIHLFNKENLWFSEGNKPLKAYNINGVKVGVMICFDWIFPETCRTLALQGAQVIAHPSNLVMPYCQKAMVTRCIENRTFAVTANRIGNEKRGGDDFTFTGASQITAIDGNILSSAPTNKEHISVIEIDENAANNKNINEFNHLINDRRLDFYKT
jgi:predicted amidohydrolase